jgi:hypothetical protein
LEVGGYGRSQKQGEPVVLLSAEAALNLTRFASMSTAMALDRRPAVKNRQHKNRKILLLAESGNGRVTAARSRS